MTTKTSGLRCVAVMAMAVMAAAGPAACGSGSAGSATSEAGTPDAEPGEASTNDASPSADAATDTAHADAPVSPSEAGNCLAPRSMTMPFAVDTVESTAGQLDTTSVACGAPASVPERVYRLVLTQPTSVTVNAGDRSGQGIGVQVRQDSCTGTSVGCDWSSNGVLARTYALPAGTWLFIVERNPAGLFTFTATP